MLAKPGLGRQVKHLPALDPQTISGYQAAAAALAALRLVRHHHRRLRHLGKVMSLSYLAAHQAYAPNGGDTNAAAAWPTIRRRAASTSSATSA